MKHPLHFFTFAALLAASLPALSQQPSPAEPKVLADGANAKSGRVENMHKTRFLEIFLAHRDAKSGKLVAERDFNVYDKTGPGMTNYKS